MGHKGDDESTFDEVQREIEALKHRFGKNVHFRVYPLSESKSEVVEEEQAVPEEAPLNLRFDHRPKEIKAWLDRFVIQQDEAKKALAIAICDHYNHAMEYERNPKLREEDFTKQNVIVIGPTGVGKTYLVRNIAKLIGVPFVKADATKFSETGYIGGNVEDLVRDLVTQAGGDVRLASHGIIYLDEVDKIATPPHVMGRDVSGRGVQMGLLKLMEETEVDLRPAFDVQGQIQAMLELQEKGKARPTKINTRHILFIVSGAFNGLKDIIKKRLHNSRMGFGAEIRSREDELNYFPFVTSQDFIEFGFEPEFIGRLPVHVACQELGMDDLHTILKQSEGSIIRQYERAFRAYGIEALFSDAGLREIAVRAHAERTGARGLMTVCERTLRDYKFELPSSEVTAFVIDEEVVRSPLEALQRILEEPGHTQRQVTLELLARFEEEYHQRHGIRLRFDQAARIALCDQALEEGERPRQLCERLFRSYEHGLNLIRKNTGRDEFEVTLEVLGEPDAVLERWVRESYSRGKEPAV